MLYLSNAIPSQVVLMGGVVRSTQVTRHPLSQVLHQAVPELNLVVKGQFTAVYHHLEKEKR